jgi:hypothetical protein
MILPLSRWSFTGDRRGAVLVHPDGAARGVIRYVERCRPLEPLAAIVARAAPGGRPCGRPRRVVTREGEYGAVASVTGEAPGRPWFATVGVVFLDDFFALTLGVSETAPLDDEVGALVFDDTHQLGVRRRWFHLAAPAGWRRERAGTFHAIHHGPGGARLYTFPAVPRPTGAADFAEQIARAQLAHWTGGTELPAHFAVVNQHGLSGWRWDLVTAEGPVLLFVYEDASYAYPIAFAGEVCSAVVCAVCDSVARLPHVWPFVHPHRGDEP